MATRSKYPVKPTIVIDTREKPANRLFAESATGDKQVKAYVLEKVDAGDYTVKEIPNLVVIEKKQDGKELAANFITHKERFLREVERLREFKHRYIIIQQTYAEFLDPDNWRPIRSVKKRYAWMAMVESWLIALQQNENIHFMFAGKDNAPRIAKKILLKTYEYECKRLNKVAKDAS